jgi:AraC-like DNA-binding protein
LPEFSFFSPHPALADVIEAIWDADIPDTARARAMTFQVLPGVAPTLCVHHRAPTTLSYPAGPGTPQRITGIQTRALTLHTTGPLGAVIVHFKPEAAHRFLGCDMHEFTDASVQLSDLLSPAITSLLDEQLKEATGACERVERVQAFLLQHLRSDPEDRLAQHAVLKLRNRPDFGIAQLAASLNISHKQLSRRFRTITGINLKQFARSARLGNALRARRNSCTWTEIAHDTGFSDQSHLGNEFKDMTGYSPESLFRATNSAQHRCLNASLAASGFFNTLVL